MIKNIGRALKKIRRRLHRKATGRVKVLKPRFGGCALASMNWNSGFHDQHNHKTKTFKKNQRRGL
jgi:hypothetical protein